MVTSTGRSRFDVDVTAPARNRRLTRRQAVILLFVAVEVFGLGFAAGYAYRSTVIDAIEQQRLDTAKELGHQLIEKGALPWQIPVQLNNRPKKPPARMN